MSQIVGIDPGSARIGVAVADVEVGIAFPLGTVDAKRGFAQAIKMIVQLLEDRLVKTIVVGLPLHISGDESPSSVQARQLGELLKTAFDVPIVYWDERHSTARAQELLREADRSARDQKSVIDESAATVILQSYLDAGRDGEATP